MFRRVSVIGAAPATVPRLKSFLTVKQAKLLVAYDGALTPEQDVESPIGFMSISSGDGL
jgi:hypothetical protein